jgi:hypothetical protein
MQNSRVKNYLTPEEFLDRGVTDIKYNIAIIGQSLKN